MSEAAKVQAKIELRPRTGDDDTEPDRYLIVHALDPRLDRMQVIVSDAHFPDHELLEVIDAIQALTSREIGSFEILVTTKLLSEAKIRPGPHHDYVLAGLHDLYQRLGAEKRPIDAG